MVSETTSKPGVPRVFTAAWGVLALNVAHCLLWGSAFPCVKLPAALRRRGGGGARVDEAPPILREPAGERGVPVHPYTKRGSGVVTSRVHGRSSRTMGGTA